MITFIGLDGGQGSGKSTYAQRLIPELQRQTTSPVLYIETDDFLIERALRETLPESFFLDPANRRKLWDFTRMGQLLLEVQSANSIRIQAGGFYNRKTGKRDRQETFAMGEDSIVLVGGPYLLEPEFQGLFSRLIFLDAPEDMRRERVVGRNIANGGSAERAMEIFRKFEHFYEPYWTNKMDTYTEIVAN